MPVLDQLGLAVYVAPSVGLVIAPVPSLTNTARQEPFPLVMPIVIPVDVTLEKVIALDCVVGATMEAAYLNLSVETASLVPPVVATVISTEPALPAGAVAVIWVSEFTV